MMNIETISEAAAELFALQVAQLKHDEVYHREIARLPVHARLSHMALHFCKYVGQLIQAFRSGDRRLFARTITDIFVIGLSCANTLNLKLVTGIPGAESAPSLADLGHSLRDADAGAHDDEWLWTALAIEAGKMARACEKIDHLESFPFRETITEAVCSICRIALIAADISDLDIKDAIAERFREIEPKFIFHNP